MLLGHRLLSCNRKQIPPPRLILPFLTLSVGYFPYCSFLRFPAVGAIKPLSLLVLWWPFLVIRFNKSSPLCTGQSIRELRFRCLALSSLRKGFLFPPAELVSMQRRNFLYVFFISNIIRTGRRIKKSNGAVSYIRCCAGNALLRCKKQLRFRFRF